MKTKLNILMVLALMASLVGMNTGGTPASVNAAPPTYVAQGSVNVAPATPTLTAVDPLAWGISGDVMPARPFLYSVDKNGITIIRFNDNKVVSQYPTASPTLPGGEVLGTWPWPTDVIYTVTPDGGFMGLTPPEWEPVAMTVSYPTEGELGNRVKPFPDLTPPPTYVYVVMAHSGYQWVSTPDATLLETANVRDHLVPMTSAATESALLIQIDVSDPSFSASLDPANPVPPHLAAAILGHGAGQPVYDRTTGNVYVGNLPSTSLPAGLTSFVSVIQRIPPEVAEVEAEVPGISVPVIRCGPQHPEAGIPVGRPHAFACYDPGGVHPINDNEHVGAYGEIKQWDTTNPDLLQEQYVWEFRNLPDWLLPHTDKLSGEYDGILYGTPPAVGEWVAEARVHDLGDPFGEFSDWTPIVLSVRPTAEYLPIKAQFAAGVPVAYPLEGTGDCALTGAPAWVDVQAVPNGCIVMGRAPIDGEYYSFTMPGLAVNGYPGLSLTFSGNVFGEYGFVPLTEGVGISGLAWRQISKVMDPSTETSVMSLEYIGVDPSTGQLWRILPPPGQPQPPNERPPETALTLDVVSAEGTPLSGSGFGAVAVEVDRDIFVAADAGVIKVSGGTASAISLGFRPSSLSLDSDLRTAIVGVEPGQVDYNVLWAAGAGTVAVIDTADGSVAQSFTVDGASSVSVDVGTRFAYAANGSSDVAIFGPDQAIRPQMAPRIWSAEEFTWNLGETAEVQLMATGDAIPALSMIGTIPPGLTFTPNADGTATIGGAPTAPSGGEGGELDVEGGDYAMAVTATSAQGTYAQAFGITVQSPPTITSGSTATFVVGSASAFQVTAVGYPDPIAYILDPQDLPVGLQLIDNEDGTASLKGTPETAGTYVFHIYATTDCPPDAEQVFTLTVLDAGTAIAPVINSVDAATWDFAGDPFPPDAIAVTSAGSPTPTLSVVSGTLPPGATFTDNGDSTATIGTGLVTTLPVGSVGTYTFTIRASNGVTPDVDQIFTLTVGLDKTLMAVNPTTLSMASDGTFVPTAPVLLTTQGDTLPFAVATTADWLSASPESGFINGTTGTSINISANAAGLLPGTYTGTVFFNSAGTEGPAATVEVTLTVVGAAPGAMSVWPGTLRYEYQANNGILPPAQTVWVMTGGEARNYTVSTDDAKWLSAPASGTAPGGFPVSVIPRVGVGMHIGNLTIAFDNGPNAPQTVQTIPVTLIKTAGDKDLVQVIIDVGGSPEGIAANLNTHNLFITSSSAAAEAGPESEGGPEVELPGPPEPSLVLHIDPVNKKLLGEIVVHSEGEYIGVNSTTGRAYHASQGTGEVAVIDGATNTAVAFIPLTIGQDVYQPYQVAIDEAQNLIYVGAKSPEPEGKTPDPLIPDANGKYGCKAMRELLSDEAPAGQQELECWHAGAVFVIDGKTNTIVGSFFAGDDPEGVVFAKATGKVYASNEDDGSITVAKAAKRNSNGTFTPPQVLGTIIHGKFVASWWQPTCDANNYCGERGVADLWPTRSACYGIDDESEEADKMAVDPSGNVYIIDDRYRVAKINGKTDTVDKVLPIPGFDCERSVPDQSEVLFRNTANNIAYMALGQGKLYVTSEQNTLSLIDPGTLTIKATLSIPKAVELDAITTDPGLNQVYITDEGEPSLWILKGACANGKGQSCVQ